jgi:hypothetical protein
MCAEMKRSGEKYLWPISRYHPGIYLDGILKTTDRVVGALPKTR